MLSSVNAGVANSAKIGTLMGPIKVNNYLNNLFRDLRDDGVSEASKAVHSAG